MCTNLFMILALHPLSSLICFSSLYVRIFQIKNRVGFFKAQIHTFIYSKDKYYWYYYFDSVELDIVRIYLFVIFS